jgi:hypothetical protein
MPGIVWVSMCFIVFGILLVSLTNLTRKTGLAMGLVFSALVAFPLYVLVRNGNLVGANVQPRYIYPLIIMLVTLAVVSLAKKVRLTALPLWIIVGLLTVANSVAIHVNMQRYIVGTGHPSFNLDAAPAWWWSSGPTPMTVWAISTILFGIFATLSTWFVAEYVSARGLACVRGGGPKTGVSRPSISNSVSLGNKTLAVGPGRHARHSPWTALPSRAILPGGESSGGSA